MKITIEDKEYELDEKEAMRQGLLVPVNQIDSFLIGDVFSSHDHAQIVVIKAVWIYPKSEKDIRDIPVYAFVGNSGSFECYSNITKLLTYNEVIDYLNEHRLEYKGNLNEILCANLKKVVKDQFC